jgi:hypothetical protein
MPKKDINKILNKYNISLIRLSRLRSVLELVLKEYTDIIDNKEIESEEIDDNFRMSYTSLVDCIYYLDIVSDKIDFEKSIKIGNK